MNKFFLIALGGAGGALLRYAVSGWTHRFVDSTFPWGTLVVNLSGCFCIGFLWALAERARLAPGVALFLFTGTLGAYTTFSTYGLESINLLRDGAVGAALLNILASNVAGLVAVYAGFLCARLLTRPPGVGGAP